MEKCRSRQSQRKTVCIEKVGNKRKKRDDEDGNARKRKQCSCPKQDAATTVIISDGVSTISMCLDGAVRIPAVARFDTRQTR